MTTHSRNGAESVARPRFATAPVATMVEVFGRPKAAYHVLTTVPAQTCRNLSVLVWNGGGTDAVRWVVEAFAERPNHLLPDLSEPGVRGLLDGLRDQQVGVWQRLRRI